ncbi:MAG: long-chain acyl-CoA synthetase [Candidatus Azotimanducaceae bacterium]|jgi:long-chain acyl-CoA synthetase|tara:strand:+ start:157 stop:1707 length:1551 start_codon:yes stop_codon:yes gene_type:complete
MGEGNMSPADIAAETPQKIAYIMAETGETVTYSELEAAANRGAQLLRSLGLQRGDHIAILLENHPRFFQICWAAQRAGIYYTAISWRLQQQEVEYIVNNCEARVFITSVERKEVVQPLLGKMDCVEKSYMLDGVVDGFESWEDALARMPTTEIADQSEGAPMLYSSGTTGYPKGVKRPLPEQDYGVEVDINLLRTLYGANDDSIYLSPAPLYHAAPLAFTMGCLRSGTTVVVMAHFEAEFALECIENYRITHSQWVPTMFVRMLKLPEEVRLKYDVSSLRCAIHAAAPCPIPIKEKMINWWGPVIYEYYAGTEGNGFVQLNSEEWLAHRGSVGKPLTCEIHICDEHGVEVPAGESGAIYMSGGGTFEYYKDDDKTADSRHAQGWSTLGDVGYLDDDGYLYLTDRKHFMIISGGVNIYPQEAENVLINHDKVMDVAVFGVPNADFGEEVKGVVQLADPSLASPMLEVELLDYCREYLSHIKCPRSIDFRDELPRHPTGKLYKRLLKDEYWAKAAAAS